MSAVTVRGVALGQGRPKIIVPIFAQTAADAAGQAAALGATAADLAELRLDPLRAEDGSLPDAAALCAAVRRVRAALGGLPLNLPDVLAWVKDFLTENIMEVETQ